MFIREMVSITMGKACEMTIKRMPCVSESCSALAASFQAASKYAAKRTALKHAKIDISKAKAMQLFAYLSQKC